MGQLGDLSPQGSIAVGVLVGLISTSLQAIGLTLQRKSHLLEEEKYAYDLRRPPYRRRRWQLGMFMFVISNIVGSTIQITTLPLPVLSTLQASGLVFNTIFATLLLGEPFTRFSVYGTLLVCIGAVLIATFGAIGEPAHTLDQLLVLLARRPFLLWMGGTALIIGITLLGGRVLKMLSTPGKARGWVAKYGLPQTLSFHTPRIKVLRGVLYGSVSGILSAHSLLVAKSAVELLVRTIVDRVNQFNRWQSWVILLGMVALALTQLYYMHRGLKLCSTSILYPFVFCIYNIIAILDGLVYFHQASRLSGLHAGLIALGTVVLLSGVLCLSWRLEEVSGHPPPVGPTPTPLTPGMGIMEESTSPPGYSDFVYPPDEEAHPRERQPLLSTPQHPHPPPHRHTLSHLRTSPQHRRSITDANTETAQIWAELDDDEGDADILSALPQQSPSSVRRSHKRHRSKSSATPLLSSSKTRSKLSSENELPPSPSPMNGSHDRAPSSGSRIGIWGPRRLPFLNRNVSRRTSAPIIHPPPQPRRRYLDAHGSSNTGQSRDSLDENASTRLEPDLPPISDQDTTNHNHNDAQHPLLSSEVSAETQHPFLGTWANRLRRLRQWSSGGQAEDKSQSRSNK